VPIIVFGIGSGGPAKSAVGTPSSEHAWQGKGGGKVGSIPRRVNPIYIYVMCVYIYRAREIEILCIYVICSASGLAGRRSRRWARRARRTPGGGGGKDV